VWTVSPRSFAISLSRCTRRLVPLAERAGYFPKTGECDLWDDSGRREAHLVDNAELSLWTAPDEAGPIVRLTVMAYIPQHSAIIRVQRRGGEPRIELVYGRFSGFSRRIPEAAFARIFDCLDETQFWNLRPSIPDELVIDGTALTLEARSAGRYNVVERKSGQFPEIGPEWIAARDGSGRCARAIYEAAGSPDLRTPRLRARHDCRRADSLDTRCGSGWQAWTCGYHPVDDKTMESDIADGACRPITHFSNGAVDLACCH